MGGDESAAALRQQRAGVEDRRRNRHRHDRRSYRFPDLPDNLYSQPTLVWTLDNRGADAQRVEASYLTSNMNWSADYVLTVGARRENRGPRRLGDAREQQRRRVQEREAAARRRRSSPHQPAASTMRSKAMAANEAAAAPAPQFQQEGFSEYHLYTLERRTSIQNNESKQISLLTGTGIPVEKYLSVEGQPYYYRNPQGIGNADPAAGESLSTGSRTTRNRSLGMPLPAGTVRVYQADSKGGTQFAGEDTIDHTPKDETLRIYVGNASTWCASASRWTTRSSRAISTRWSIRSRCATTRTAR